MSHRKPPANDLGYKVDVNPDVAFSMTYDGHRGRLVFSIEVDDDPKKIFLNPRPSQGNRAVDVQDKETREWVAIAVERVKGYFRAQGKVVEVD